MVLVALRKGGVEGGLLVVDEEDAEGDEAGDYVRCFLVEMLRGSLVCVGVGGGGLPTGEELDGQPEPDPGDVLGLGTICGDAARVDGAADDGHCDGEEGKREDGGEDELLAHAEADSPEDGDWEAED